DLYIEYLEKREHPATVKAEGPKVEKAKTEKPKSDKKKLSFKEQKEWETIADDIEKTELAIMETEDGIANAGSDFTKLEELTAKLDELNAHYERPRERWSYS
ncbi:ABC transporter C-terminal domain-containing protein, partial [Bacillus velezensis]|uniref:ABC transporter C-terminal domain-containing protein n=1 Tax=Bacillus velezensis TaxID=492670 RepID=UPI0020BFA70B